MQKPVNKKSYLWSLEDQQRVAAVEQWIAAQPQLAAVEQAMTVKWGKDRLPTLVDTDLQGRFTRQMDRLCDAVAAENWPDAVALLPGMVRGYSVLDEEADKLGAKPVHIEIKSISHRGKEYRLVETIKDSWSVTPGDYDIISVEELLNLNDAVRSGFIEGRKIVDKGITVEEAE